MKYFIMSDIHGSETYLEKALACFEKENADRIIILGDILYHGPRNDLPMGYGPKKVISLLSPLSSLILAVRGNCEAEVDQMVLDFPVLAAYAVLEHLGKLVYITHGHTPLPKLKGGDIVLSGHTHVPACTEENGILHLNPGSVSIPKENSPHSYMTLENGLFIWKDLDGNEYKRHAL